MPSWAGVDAVASAAVTAGFGIVAVVAATLFVGLMGFHMLRKLLSAAGL